MVFGTLFMSMIGQPGTHCVLDATKIRSPLNTPPPSLYSTSPNLTPLKTPPPAPPAAGFFFDLPGLASFINLLFSTSQSRTGRAVFTVGQSREKRAFGRGDW